MPSSRPVAPLQTPSTRRPLVGCGAAALALTAVLVIEPELVIADEPTTALDVTTQAQVIELVRAPNRWNKTEHGLARTSRTGGALGLTAGLVLEVEPDRDDGEHPAGRRRRGEQMHRFRHAEGHRLVGEDPVGMKRRSVRVMPARHVGGDDPRVLVDRCHPGPGHLGQPRPAPDPEDPVDDEVGHHDTLGGACSQESNTLRYGHHTKHQHACVENFLIEGSRHGLGKRDLVGNVNFYMYVPVDPDGTLGIVDGLSAPGKKVVLRAEIDTLVLISNCPQINNPCNGFDPTAVRVIVTRPAN